MVYTDENFRTKKALIEAVKAGKAVTVYQPNDMFGNGIVKDGQHCAEGPHYPEPHKWYATITVKDGKVVSAK